MQNEKYMISCDWFQYYCVNHFKVVHAGTYLNGKKPNPRGYVSQYYIKGSSEVLQGYKERFGIYLHNFLLATIATHPTTPYVRRDGCAIKVNNRLLYTQEWSFYLHDIIAALGWEIKAITRIDLAYDCNFFHGHLHPQALIQSYLNPQFANLAEGTGEVEVTTKKNIKRTVSLAHRSFIRKGSNRFAVEGVKALHQPIFEYLRFGSRKSSVCAYIYNKSQELRVKKSKPYISGCWDEVGLDTTEVYRVEISINSSGTWLAEKGFGKKGDETHNKILRLDDFAFDRVQDRIEATQERIEEMFMSYAAEYFAFHIDTGQRYVKDMPKVHLFECDKTVSLKPIHMNRMLDTGKAERMVANHLNKLQQTYPWFTTQQMVTLDEASKIFSMVSGIKRMKDEEDKYIEQILIPMIQPDLMKRMREFLEIQGIKCTSPIGVVNKIITFMRVSTTDGNENPYLDYV